MCQSLMSSEVRTDIFFDFNSNMTNSSGFYHLDTQFFKEPFESQYLINKGPFYYIIGFFEVHFKPKSIISPTMHGT
jgi:hypothetical protein